jgi:hypothetical protein
MATAATVRAWRAENGHPQVKGKLPRSITDEWDLAHPDDPYESTPAGRGPGLISDAEMDDLFPDVDAVPEELAETRPRPVSKARKTTGTGTGFHFPFISKPPDGGKKKKVPRVSTESLLGSVWRGAAKLATPLPPLHRTLRVQAPVAGLLLEDAVKGTMADTILQPLARMAETGKAVSALLGPPLFVTAITVHASQRAAQELPPNPVFMAIATEGLRSSLMTWMDVAGPKFVEAVRREREFEEKYGSDVDEFMNWLFAPPPATEAEHQAEEAMFRHAMGVPEPATM